MELESSFHSATATIGDPVRARVVEVVRRSGKPILPEGAIATGRIRSMERQARAGGFLLGIELTGMRWGNSRAEFRAELLEARTGAQIKRTGGLQAGNSNIVGLSGSIPSTEIPLPEHSGTQIGVASGIPGAGWLFVMGAQWRLAAGPRLGWRTSRP